MSSVIEFNAKWRKAMSEHDATKGHSVMVMQSIEVLDAAARKTNQIAEGKKPTEPDMSTWTLWQRAFWKSLNQPGMAVDLVVE